MGQSAALFCHNGLGNGVNSLVLANNLHLNGWQVDMYQNVLGSMQNWFPHLNVLPYPSLEDLPRILNTYHWFFIIQNETDPFILKLIQEGKRRFPDRLKVIYLYPSKRIVNEPYYNDCLTNPKLSVAENLRLFCEKVLRLPKISKNNGLIPPAGLVSRKHLKRVVIHPTSTREIRSWPKEKFLEFGKHLQKDGFEVILVPQAKEGWEGLGFEVPLFSTLDLLARYLYESGFLVGNDSGLGHLASALGIPTLTVCRRKTLANMWAPSFHKGLVVTPSPWIPNIRGLRLRDRYWKSFISVGKARRAFERLIHLA